jgi:large repetitive protein
MRPNSGLSRRRRGRAIAASGGARSGVVRSVAALAAVGAGLGGLALLRNEPTTAIDGAAATVWLSGEGKGRVVLASARAERPSIGIALDTVPTTDDAAADQADQPAGFDLADTGKMLLVHDRAGGEVVVLDARSGLQRDSFAAPKPSTAAPALVAAGSSAYLVDAETSSALKIDADGAAGEPVAIADGFTSWVGTPDGVLYLINQTRGTWTRFNGVTASTLSFTDPGTDVVLLAVGNDPVVVDRSARRLRWLRRNTSAPIDAALGNTAFVAQNANPQSTCVSVLTPRALACFGPTGIEQQVALADQGALDDVDLAAAQLIAGPRDVVVDDGSGTMIAVDAALGAVERITRSAVSPRRLVGWSGAGPLVIDDPGSRFAYTVDRGQIIELDKFSRRTVVLSTDGTPTEDGLSTLNDSADVAGADQSSDGERPQNDNNGRNDPPVANPDTAATRVDRPVTVDVLANDTDPDGDSLAVVEAGPLAASSGTVTVLEGSRVNFVPSATSRPGTVSFQYRITDPGGLEATATVTIELTTERGNSAVVANDDEATTTENQSVDVEVLANDEDEEGDRLTISEVTEPEHGSAAIGDDGTIRYEPDPGYTGTDRFGYTVIDGFGSSADATVRITIEPAAQANRPPVAVDDRTAAQRAVRVRVEALLNDSDPDGDSIRIVDVAGPPELKVSISGAGALDITPAAQASGLLSVGYTIEDAEGLRASANVAVVVEDAGTSQPVAVDDFATSASVAVQIDVVANDVDPKGKQLVVTEVTQPEGGSGAAVRLSPTVVQFSPTAGFVGTARFSYTVTNSDGLSARANVTVAVISRSGSGPVARDDSVTVFAGQAATIAALGNDTHPDGLPFDYAGKPLVRSGTATVNADRSITFTPPDDSVAVYTVEYTIQDPNGRKSSATITVNVVARPKINRPPAAVNDVAATAFRTAVSVDVLANDTDPDGDPMTVTAVSGVSPAGAGAAEIAAGRVRFSPAADFVGVVSMQYTVADAEGATATATATVQVADRVRVPPVAGPDLVNLVTGQAGRVSPLLNDIDPDGTPGSLTITALGAVSPSGGPSASLVGDEVRLTAGGAAGTFSVTYTIADADRLTAVGVITVVIDLPANQPPVAVNDALTQLAVGSVINVLANDLDPDGGALTISSVGPVSPAGAGAVSTNGAVVSFSTDSSTSGVVTFPYTVRDQAGATASATVTLTITACPAVPSLSALSAVTRYATPVAIPLFGGGPAPGTVEVSTPTAGTATLSGGNTVVYSPPAGFNGSATMTYSVRTVCNAVATSTITVIVNRQPNAAPDAVSTGRNQPVNVNVLANDSDPDGDTLTVASVSPGTGGSVSLSGGEVTFAPSLGFVGAATFTYVIRDIGGLTDVGSAVITVSNGGPAAAPDSVTIPTLTSSVAIPVLANDSDPNLDALSIVSVQQPSPGNASVSGGNVVYSPDPGQGPGQVVFSYTITDGIATSSASITVTITNRPPDAAPDFAELLVANGPSVTVNVVANDSDPDGSNASLQLVGASVTSGNGAVSTSGDSITFTIAGDVLTPTSATVSYTIRDADGATASSTVTITVS